MTKETEDLLLKIDQAILTTDWVKIDSLARKCRRRKYISQAMENILIAEGELQKCLAEMSLDISEEKEELEFFVPVTKNKQPSLETAIDAIKKIFTSATDREKKYGYMLKAKVAMLQGRWKEAGEALDNLVPDDLKNILLAPLHTPSMSATGTYAATADSGTLGSLDTGMATTGEEITCGNVLEKLLAVQAQYIRGLCLEAEGKAYKALSEYVVVTASYRESPFDRLWKTPAFQPFIALSMYRYGILCWQLAGSRSAELPPVNLESLRQKLLHDAGIALRMFLVFEPSVDPMKPCGKNRKIVALKRYMQILEIRFQSLAFKAAFSPDQYQTINEQSSFIPENVPEDIVLASLLMESYHSALPENKLEAQSGAMAARQKNCAKRLARFGCSSLLCEFYESLFERFAATPPLYGNLLLAYMSNQEYDKAYIAGDTYHLIGGKDPFILLAFCKVSLLFNIEKVKKAVHLLEGLLEQDTEEVLDLLPRIIEYLAKGYLLMAQNCLPEHPSEARMFEEKAVQLIEGHLAKENHCPGLYMTLGMAYICLKRLPEAERALKAALVRDGSNAQAWYILALLRTAAQDYEGALEICNIQLDQQSHPDLDICLLKTAILSLFDQGDEAVELTKAIFSYWVCRSESTGGMAAWLGPLAEPSSSAPTSGDAETDSVVTITRFRQKFLGRSNLTPSSGEPTTILRFTEIANRFPQPPAETKCSLLGLTTDAHFFSVKERLALHEWVQHSKIHQGGKRYGIAKQLWLWLSKLYLADRIYHEAELAVMAAFAVDELFPEVYYRLGRVMEARGKTAEAIEEFERGLQLDPDHPGCHLGLARRYYHLGLTEQQKLGLAYSHATAVIKISPGDARAMHLLAEIFVAMGEEAQAGIWYKRALEVQDTSPLLQITPLSFILASFYG